MITDPNIPKKFDAVLVLRPNGGFTVSVKGKVEYLHEGDPEPTEEQIQAKLKELQADYDAKQYQRDRLKEYPSIQECIHAILDDDLEALQAKRTAVKAKYPKPE